MLTIEDLMNKADSIEGKLHYSFKERQYLVLAFTHRSYVNENKEVNQHNERLEFLGDSVLGLLAAEYLYRHLPDTPEGDLSYLRSRLVEAISCISYIKKLELEQFLLLGKGERRNDGRGRDSIIADLFEAIIGAIYLDGGIEAARKFFFQNFDAEIQLIMKTPLKNWKALLQDLCQKKYQKTPIYKIVEETGPDHCKIFTVAVSLHDAELGSGQGASKKEAAQAAAEEALKRINKCSE